MPGTHDLALFVIAGLLLNMAPGPDSLLIMTRSAAQGWRAGSAASLGIGAGTFVHVVAAALGLSAVLATSATAFAVVKYAGAAYLLYVGLVLLVGTRRRAAETDSGHAPAPPMPLTKIFFQGFLTNVLNPKVAVFFLAFVPQFIDADAPSKALAFIALGTVFNVNSMLWCHFLALSTALASRRVRVSARLGRWIERGIGAMFVSFGVKLALAERH
jgi:threonine/homoserine/homoserine lactone efflux protein